MTINIILQQRAEQRAGKFCHTDKSQLLQGSGKRLLHPAQHQRAAQQQFSFIPPCTHQGYRRGRCTWTKGLIWHGNSHGAASQSSVPARCFKVRTASPRSQRLLFKNPELKHTKAAATATVLAATARFPQPEKGGSESFCSPGERVETNKKGRGRIKVILNR